MEYQNRTPGLFAFLSLLLYGVSGRNQDLLGTVFLRLFIGPTMDVHIDQPLENATFLLSKMENSKPTVLYIHGFTESIERQSTVGVVSAFLKRNDHNILAVDYHLIANQSYGLAVKGANLVGLALASALNDMVEAGLDKEKLYLVGLSLGAQVAGRIGQETSFEIPRITGLDPAGPLFNFRLTRLTSSDARFVDVIHTDAGGYGISRNSGTVDFYPNGGRRLQPGCPRNTKFLTLEDFCSHVRSWRFYAESLLNETAFVTVKCRTYSQFSRGKCEKNEEILMGFATPTNANGTFYLKTKAESPYGMGKQGIKALDTSIEENLV